MRTNMTPPANGASAAGLGRRELLRRGAACACAGVIAKGVSLSSVLLPAGAARAAGGGQKYLVLFRLYGGNDGLNTVIPYQTNLYYDRRPSILVPGDQALPISSTLAFHPRMSELHRHFQAGRLAVIQSTGYDPPNLSHFRSEVIWQSADPNTINPTGWIGRYLDTLAPAGDPAVRAVNHAYGLDHVFLSSHANVFALPSPEAAYFPTDYFGNYGDNQQKRTLFDRLSLAPRASGSPAETMATAGYAISQNVDRFDADSIGDLDGTVTFPAESYISDSLRAVARNIAAAERGDIAASIYQVGIGGFDTHSDQNLMNGHPDLWGEISSSLDAFHAEMTHQGLADRVLVLVYSEFGRRVEENGSAGTDHGTAAPMFAFGNAVVGGLYGAEPDLSDLDPDDNLRTDIDFRRVYATVAERWLGADSQQILLGTFSPVPFLTT